MTFQVVLPAGLECWQCIMQWTYVTGNSWGSGPQVRNILFKLSLQTIVSPSTLFPDGGDMDSGVLGGWAGGEDGVRPAGDVQGVRRHLHRPKVLS